MPPWLLFCKSRPRAFDAPKPREAPRDPFAVPYSGIVLMLLRAFTDLLPHAGANDQLQFVLGGLLMGLLDEVIGAVREFYGA